MENEHEFNPDMTPEKRKEHWRTVINHLVYHLGLGHTHPAVIEARKEAAAQGVTETP